MKELGQFYNRVQSGKRDHLGVKIMENGDKYVLISMEGSRHVIEPKVLEMSEYLKGLKESGSISNNTVTLENVKEISLSRVVEFCEFCFVK